MVLGWLTVIRLQPEQQLLRFGFVDLAQDVVCRVVHSPGGGLAVKQHPVAGDELQWYTFAADVPFACVCIGNHSDVHGASVFCKTSSGLYRWSNVFLLSASSFRVRLLLVRLQLRTELSDDFQRLCGGGCVQYVLVEIVQL